VIGRVTHGAGSIVKTQVLRRDRVSEADYQARLEVCRHCPGGHATFKADGNLHTCGPMIQSLKQQGQKTCGCVLSKKARDAEESCPFGYWPTLEGKPVTERVQLPIANPDPGELVADERIRRAQLRAMRDGFVTRMRRAFVAARAEREPVAGRRRFLKRSAAVLGALVFVPRAVFSANDVKRWVAVDPCDPQRAQSCSRWWIRCDEGCGREIGSIFETDGFCYKLSAHITKEKPDDADILYPGPWHETCDKCDGGTCDNGPYFDSDGELGR